MKTYTAHLSDSTLDDWMQVVRSEYLEIPGLSLTKRQVQRLWGLESELCEALLRALVDLKFLRCTSLGTYVLAN